LNLIESAFKFLKYIRNKRKEKGREEKRERKQVLLILYVNQSYLIIFHVAKLSIWYQNCKVFIYLW